MTEKSLFYEALDKPPGERVAFLDVACAGQPQLRAAVEALLAAHEAAGSFLDKPAVELGQTVDSAPGRAELGATGAHTPQPDKAALPPAARPPGSGAGAVIAGRYTLVEKIGEGGMGEVWVAKQTEPVKRKVALKLIKTGMDSKAVLARFEQERQALAMMDHPNIARVLDGGMTPTGQPFFVMELVNGLPLTRFCDEAKLTPHQRLELFVPICQAVQHAHQKGIVHRDIKPANILVTIIDGRPVPKVIDFGVAKAVEGKITDEELNTQFGAIVGTLEYMSPEQAGFSGVDIDTRSDIYSLGVLLYELLTGLRPIDAKRLKKAAFSEMIRIIQEEEPSRPSTRLSTDESLPSLAALRQTEPRRLTALLRGELDWVVMKCLQKQRDRRYETANALARDVQRYLADEPVEARPPSAGYRLGKFLRRNKGPVVAGGLVLLALVAGIVGTTWGMVRAVRAREAETEQRQIAQALAEAEAVERRQAEIVAQLLERTFRDIDPSKEVEQGTSFKEQMIAKLDQSVAELSSFAGEPLVKARLLHSLGITLLGLSEHARGEKLLREALALRRQHLGSDDPKTLNSMFSLGATCQHLGRFDETLTLYGEYRERSIRHLSSDDPRRVQIDHVIGMAHQAAGNLDRAVVVFERVADWLKRHPKPDTADRLLKLHTLGAAYRETHRTKEAIAIFEDVLQRRAKLLGLDHPDTLMTTNSLGVVYVAAGRYQDSIKLLEQTSGRLLKRFAADHVSVLMIQRNLAGAYSKAGRLQAAIELLESIRDRAVARLGPNSAYTSLLVGSLADVYKKSKRFDEAIKLYEQSIKTLAATYGMEHPRVAPLINALANCYFRTGKRKEAVAELTQLSQRQAARFGPDHRETLATRRDLALLHRSLGQAKTAIEILLDVTEKSSKSLGPDHLQTLSARNALAASYFAARRPQQAIEIFEKVLAQRIEQLGAEHLDTLDTRRSLGSSYWLLRKYDRSIPLIAESLRGLESVLGIEDERTLSAAGDLAINYRDAELLDKLIDHWKVWQPRLVKAFGSNRPNIIMVTSRMVAACQARDRIADTIPIYETLRDLALKRSGPDHVETMQLTNNLASGYWFGGRLDRSVPLFEELVKASRKKRGENHPQTIGYVGNYAINLRDAGRVKEAIPLLEETIDRTRKLPGGTPRKVAFFQNALALAYQMDGQLARAETLYRTLQAESREQNGPTSEATTRVLAELARCLLVARKPAEAERIARECLTIRVKQQPDAWRTFGTQSLLGGALLGQQKYADAEPLLVKGYQGMQEREAKIPPLFKPRLREAVEWLIQLYEATDRKDEAAKWRMKLEAIKGGEKKQEKKP
jgi:tetratricopeptide (TPR) repeat protein